MDYTYLNAVDGASDTLHVTNSTLELKKKDFEQDESQTWLLTKGQVECQKPIKKHTK